MELPRARSRERVMVPGGHRAMREGDRARMGVTQQSPMQNPPCMRPPVQEALYKKQTCDTCDIR